MRLNKGKLPSILLDRVQKGEEKTRSQWAKALGVTVPMIQAVMGRLRKQGYMIYPVGTMRNIGGMSEEGIIRDVLESKKYVSEVMHNSSKIEILPRIKSGMRLVENALIEFPEISDEIETWASEILMMSMHNKQEVKKIKADPEAYENLRNPAKPDQAGSKPTA